MVPRARADGMPTDMPVNMPLECPVDAACLPALTPLRVTTMVLDLSVAAQAGDLAAQAGLEAVAALLEGCET